MWLHTPMTLGGNFEGHMMFQELRKRALNFTKGAWIESGQLFFYLDFDLSKFSDILKNSASGCLLKSPPNICIKSPSLLLFKIP